MRRSERSMIKTKMFGLLLVSSAILLLVVSHNFSIKEATKETDIFEKLSDEVGNRLVLLNSDGLIIGYVKDEEGQVICYFVNSTLFNQASQVEEVIDKLLQGTPIIFIGAPDVEKLGYPWPASNATGRIGGTWTVNSNCKLLVIKVYENTCRGARVTETASFNEESALNLAYHWAEERYDKKILH